MKTKLIRIGNSQGFVIPKVVLEQVSCSDTVDIAVSGGNIILKTRRNPHEGWAEAYERLAASGEDEILIDAASTTTWDNEEWEWE
jgi:antitoxin MazE